MAEAKKLIAIRVEDHARLEALKLHEKEPFGDVVKWLLDGNTKERSIENKKG